MTQNAKSLAELGLTALPGPMRGHGPCHRQPQGPPRHAFRGASRHAGPWRAFRRRRHRGRRGGDPDRPRGRGDRGRCAVGSNVALIVAEDARATLAHAAALWFGPGPETVVAVTGTNGKTSVASFTRQIWERLGHRAVNIGTTGVEGSYSAPGIHTTPDALTLQALLADIRADGIDRVAMEASSHGLDQRRMEAVSPCAAAFTNLTQDHLDYHGTMEAYFDAKLRLFTELLPEDGVAVVNLDDPYGQRVAEIVEARGNEVVGVAQYTGAAELKITGRRLDERGQDVLVEAWGKPIRVRLPLIGAFQAMNVMTAAGLAIASGDEPDAVFGVLPELTGVRGRMQLAGVRDNGAPVYVDYAHTPDALERRSRRCARMCWDGSTWSSARAATATGASVR
jgi:UDP-N-acetylmuramoyl-L-alanyl-D-glutamate--2,6-diaminopimelate ligase